MEISETSRKRKASDLDEKSPVVLSESPLVFSESLAEFFAGNKNNAGFENPRKALYTTVRELVENGLDSAESIGEFPVIEVTIEEISRSCYNSTIDDDSEKLLDKNSALGIKVEERTAAKPMKGGSFYRVTCTDNGRGIPHDAIPDIFGRVSIRKKYGMKQTRGKSGLGGVKMVSVWSNMSTGVPVEIYTGMKDQKYRTSCSLDIDIHRNMPIVHSLNLTKSEDGDDWHGAKITVVIKGNYGSGILEYMRLMAVITPYAEFKFEYIGADENGVVKKSYPRISEKMPRVPVQTKYHPSAVDSLSIIPRLIGQTSNQNLLWFLQHEFVKINKTQALQLIGKMGPGVTSETQVNSLTFPQIDCMHELFQQAQFDDPSGNCLSPLGEYGFGLGINQVLQPEVVRTYTSKRAQVYQGHPFIVEAGVSVGGNELKQGLNIFRFANRVPLLFEQDADVVTTTAMERIQWKRYKINKDHDKVGVFVNIVSTKKIPFEGTGDDISQIADAVKTCLEHCCKRLKQDILKAEIKSDLEFTLGQASSALAYLETDDPVARVDAKKKGT
ncbi:hypothetical protein LXL04_025509 [Taraxacum kok-saghyz]